MTDLDEELLVLAREQTKPVSSQKFVGIILDGVWVMRRYVSSGHSVPRVYASVGLARKSFAAMTYYVARDFYAKKKIRFTAPDTMFDAHQRWVRALEDAGRLSYGELQN